MELPPTALLVRHPDMIAAEMDGETVMMSIERGEYFGLAGVGGRLWQLLAQPASQQQLVEALCTEYAVDAATCRADVQRFVDEMLAHGLLRRA